MSLRTSVMTSINDGKSPNVCSEASLFEYLPRGKSIQAVMILFYIERPLKILNLLLLPKNA
ncbi:hypothetical protein M7I_4081 [Glarea lozoyensis 74030]|uniref:Uncharacterized protein n=1 Tax=Glarea lozoyensis (strain ATCC 74030 / MF5533) TaxID=1104152 RepID=H0EN78_GLAL7|nr:hypothetical protein M7I_4081 [Glarea lozoyensis 74030]